MDNLTDNDSVVGAQDTVSGEADQLDNPNRRRFSRNALAGSAVLLSLGNRSAWGQTMGCMSLATLNSFDPSTGMFISAPAGRPTRNEDLAAAIHDIADAPTFQDSGILTGGNGDVYSSCQDPDSIDGVCLIKDLCP